MNGREKESGTHASVHRSVFEELGQHIRQPVAQRRLVLTCIVVTQFMQTKTKRTFHTFACIRVHDRLLRNDMAEVIGIQPLLLLNLLDLFTTRFNLIGEALNPRRELSIELLVGT